MKLDVTVSEVVDIFKEISGRPKQLFERIRRDIRKVIVPRAAPPKAARFLKKQPLRYIPPQMIGKRPPYFVMIILWLSSDYPLIILLTHKILLHILRPRKRKLLPLLVRNTS
jgi:hypothetical protein